MISINLEIIIFTYMVELLYKYYYNYLFFQISLLLPLLNYIIFYFSNFYHFNDNK